MKHCVIKNTLVFSAIIYDFITIFYSVLFLDIRYYELLTLCQLTTRYWRHFVLAGRRINLLVGAGAVEPLDGSTLAARVLVTHVCC